MDYGFFIFVVPMICLFVLGMCCLSSKKDIQSAGMEGNAHVRLSQTTNHTQPSQPSTNESPPDYSYLSSTKPYIVEDDLPPSYFEALSFRKPLCASAVINVKPLNTQDNLATGRKGTFVQSSFEVSS